MSEAVAEYLDIRSARFSTSTVKNEGFVLTRFAATVVGGRDIQVRHLTPEHVEAWFVALLRPHRDRCGINRPAIQPGTYNFYYARLKAFFLYCTQRGWTRSHLLGHIHPMRDVRRVRQQPEVDYLLAMLERTADPRDRALLACAMNTGLRSGEIARLKVGDVDLTTLTLRVWVSKSQTEDDMPVTSDLNRELNRWLSVYARAIERPLQRDDYLFPAASGPRYRWRTLADGQRQRYQVDGTYVPHREVTKLHRIAQNALRSVGLSTKGEGIHTIRRAVARHYYDALAAERGHDGAIRVVMTLLHHTNVSTTEHYLGVTGERRTRDESLRGRSFLIGTPPSNVIALSGRN